MRTSQPARDELEDRFAADRIAMGSSRQAQTAEFRRQISLGKRRRRDRKKNDDDQDGYNLRLYVAGQTPKSIAAIANLKKICDQHLNGRYEIEIIDLMKNPALAQRHQIVAIPTLIRQLPEPLKRIIGDLSNPEKVLVGLDIQPT